MAEEPEELQTLKGRTFSYVDRKSPDATGTPPGGRSVRGVWKGLVGRCGPIQRRLPILGWIRRYDRADGVADLIAGLTLGLTIIPQSMAYATIAGLPSQYGLYAAFMGSLVYVFLGTVKEVSIGPTSLMALLTYQYTAGRPAEYVVVLAFAAGLVELAMGVGRLGFLVCLISVPVTSAFSSATALIIIGSQLRNLLGLSRGTGSGFFGTLLDVTRQLPEASGPDTALGAVCLVALVALQQLPKVRGTADRWRRTLWYVSLARNALVVLACAIVSFYWTTPVDSDSTSGATPWRLSGTVEPGIPTFELPTHVTSSVGNRTVGFVEMAVELGDGLLLVPLVAILANVAIAKAFASGQAVDATQELIALGLCNIIGSCFRAMPTTGAFTRSAISHASGVRTPLAGLYCALATLLALGVLTPYFYYIPRATLAAVLIAAVAPMLDLPIVARLRRTGSPTDLLAWTVCFGVCLLASVEVGLLCGMAVSLLEPLRVSIWPRCHCETVHEPRQRFSFRRVRPEHGLLYTSVDRLRTLVLAEMAAAEEAAKEAAAGDDEDPTVAIVLDCGRLVALDYSAAKALKDLADEVTRLGATLLLRDVPDRWRHRLGQLHETEHGLTFSQ
ncbi:sodium-independent sulfate anion transporter-like [Anopheles cruzii]|uniref:sodium-independent sulfate anion transporter-like n=1 Tax=Anopheles cruzii TaxID=68878 RepID=UPI0022EC4DE7|nr:sodium-independent sulfate anion transporter-like [Anopheles cruzii]